MSPRKAPEPPAHPRKSKLSNADVQALATLAMKAWETGLPEAEVDLVGDRWEFEPVRDVRMRLELRRYHEEAEPRRGEIGAELLGTETALATLASRILALAEPA